MKLTIERSALLRTLGHVQSVVEKRNTIPILANVLIRTEDQMVSFTATDMELEILETVPAQVSAGGGVTAPAHTLYDIVRKLPDGSQVELSTDGGNQLTLTSGRSRFKLGCLPVEDFPQLASGDLKHSFSIAVAELRALIDRTRFAISTEETRYYLNGIYLHTTTQRGASGSLPVLRAVATDGHRLARFEMTAPSGAEGIPGVILPRKAVQEIRKLVEEASGEIEIALSENKVRFSFDKIVLASKLIDGTFPDYERVIPTGNDKTLEVTTKEFIGAVDRVATISTDKSRAVKMGIDTGRVTLSASSAEAGSAVEELEATYESTAMEIGFNAKYLLDIAQQIDDTVIRFTLADAGAPAIVQASADPSALYVLMPMRV